MPSIIVELSDSYSEWLNTLKDKKAKLAIVARIRRMELGNAGDCDSVGDSVYEMRVHLSPGYRSYFIYSSEYNVKILCGGTKGTQKKDIAKAKEMRKALMETANE
jgi:putative addiction module killer protein